MTSAFSSPLGASRLILRLVCLITGIVAIICLGLIVDCVGLAVTAVAVFWSLIHIIFLLAKKELHPAFFIVFDFIAAAITVIIAVFGSVAVAWVNSTNRDDFHVRAVGIASAALMILTG
ncbi:hypothetical protein N7457_006387 [Penicillium paradoxum]|uniref:uncharacterized protein n=1 Tax=Penicillium paradoxum TaxID=176176 RepID=UPI0025499206|nr:uncharacterized protein N7457_006387 [Penicillium paradoxum]KAJ5781227.1 hypothetical protein N7457_006387 [Penicillium paradoxum]